MPLHRSISTSSCFDPDAIKSLAAAYEGACTELHVTVDEHSRKEIVARKIIAHALRGERDAILLRDAVLSELRPEPLSGS